MPLHVSSTCAYHQEVTIALHSLWYHDTYRCDDTSFISCLYMFRAYVLIIIALHSLWYHHTYRCDDTRSCVMQF